MNFWRRCWTDDDARAGCARGTRVWNIFAGSEWLAPILASVLLLSACGPSSEDLYAGKLPDRVDFNLHVKPILSDRCFACHGPDEKARKAKLRLDTPEGARAVIRAGSLRRSELYHRIASKDSSQMMPPRESGLALSAYEKAILARWIEQGGEYKPHWAFIVPTKPELPVVNDSGWAKGPIDRFVLARLELEGLKPSPEADRERLIHRVTYDITGLPPTLDEIDRFVKDRSPDAYEKLVDRLLASPAYGERMASEWMDLSRYADSNGYQDDGVRYMWRWRDWVIRSFNQNQPYDEFVTWQLAGDLLPNATTEQILATGFNRNHPQNGEGGIVDEEYRVQYVKDRTETFSRAFLGVTMQCAGCHDHKYDPFLQKEYYQLSAFFNNNNEIGIAPIDGNGGPTQVLLDDTARARLASLRRKITEEETALRSYVKQVAADASLATPPAPTSSDLARGLVAYFPLDAASGGKTANKADAASVGKVSDGAEIVEGKLGGALEVHEGAVTVKGPYGFDRTDPFTLSAWVYSDKKLPHSPIVSLEESLNRFGRGYQLAMDEHNRVKMALTHSMPANAIRVVTRDSVPVRAWTHIVMTYDGSSRAAGVRIYINGHAADLEVQYDRLTRTIVFPRLPLNIGAKGGSNDPSLFVGGRIDDVRIYDRMLTAPEAARLAGVDPFEGLKPADLLAYRLNTADRAYAEKLTALRRVRSEENRLVSDAEDVMVMEELPVHRPTYVLTRGAYDARGEPVEPSTPASILPFPKDLRPDRLGLAEWLFDARNPLTARVAVNHLWQMVFATGLVKTSDDFGNQGELPSHPELLDWLAVNYRDTGWDTKAMLKQMVMSSTYRQSSVATPELLARDPNNRLLARGASYRRSYEMIRDGALAASGLLVHKVGGPSVKIYQPAGLWEEKSAGRGSLARYVQDHGEDLYRRSLYTFWKRSSPPPAMTTFDAADRDVCTVRRESTDTPLQALALLNDPQLVEAARLLAERMVREGGAGADDRLRYGFRIVTSRLPSGEEMGFLSSLYQQELEHFAAHPASATKLLSAGEWKRDETLPAPEVAAYAVVANTLLNLDEFITKR
jgi:hypothetical protein